MSSSTIRKAIGVVKDQTSISLAKVAGNVAPDLEVLIVKATGHDIEPAEEKYIREILHLISQSRGYVSACVYNISKRLNKTSDWVVALKALMLVHRLLVDGSPLFGQEIMFASRKGTRVLNMSDFRVEALSNYWDHSAFVKNYALYLDQKLEFIAFERKLSGFNDKWRFEERYGGFRDDHSYGISHKSKSYGDLYYESISRKESKAVTPVKEMKPDRVLERLNKLLRLIDRGLLCRPAGSAKTNKMILVALHLVLRESFRIYADIWEALGVLLDRLPEMEYANCVKTFDQYVSAAKTIDELFDFYKWSKNLGVARASEFPEVLKITDKVLVTLERFIREKKKRLKNLAIENGPSSTTTPPQTTGDLLDLKDEIVPVDNHGNTNTNTNTNTLALALFSESKPCSSKINENGKSDWELALVESASSLSNHKVDTGVIDPVMLNDIYDNNGSSISVSGLGRTVTPAITTSVLALPAPSEPIQKVDPQDPFAASLMVPPPPYVQLADLEKKQSFLVQEQQVWQQPYGNNTMLGQVQGPMDKINGGVAAAFNGMGQHTGYNYAHY